MSPASGWHVSTVAQIIFVAAAAVAIYDDDDDDDDSAATVQFEFSAVRAAARVAQTSLGV